MSNLLRIEETAVMDYIFSEKGTFTEDLLNTLHSRSTVILISDILSVNDRWE